MAIVTKKDITNQIKNFVADNSYFELDTDDDETLSFITRENGDVGNEEYSNTDMMEAMRLEQLLKEKFKTDILSISIEQVDEWVDLTLVINNVLGE